MKRFFLLLTMIVLAGEMSQALPPNCNTYESTKIIRDPAWGADLIHTFPAGSCDLIESIDDVGVKGCAEVAEKLNYRCFQPGVLKDIDPFFGRHKIMNLCYGCL